MAEKVSLDYNTCKNPAKYYTRALREIEVLKILSCPNIVFYYGSRRVDGTFFCLYMEFCDGGSMRTLVKERNLKCLLTVPLTTCIIKSVAHALAYIHARHIVHRDLKPSNILLTTTGQVKVADFGLCCRLDSPDMNSAVGTQYIRSPEMFQLRYTQVSIDEKTDIWSLGIIIEQLLRRYNVYRTTSRRNIFHFMKTSARVFEDVEPETLRVLLRSCREYRPHDRPSAEDLLQSRALRCAASADEFSKLVHQVLAYLADSSEKDSGNDDNNKDDNDKK